MRIRRGVGAALLLALVAVAAGAAEEEAPTLSVAVREAPPFAMRETSGEWDGLSVALWEEIARGLDLRFAWRELPLDETLAALEAGEIDAAVAALTITSDRERRFDFSHPYLASGLALAVDASDDGGWLATLRAFFSLEFLTAVGALVVVLLVAALGVWIFERRANPEQFGGTVARGLGESFWWSAVTMTTVGYGDRAPVTRGGRVVAIVWMFTSVIVIASFTASIAASLAVNRLDRDALDGRSVAELRLAVLADSRAESYARQRGYRSRSWPSLEDAADALVADEVDAILHDAPILQHFARERFEDEITVLPGAIVRDDYGFAFPEESPLRDAVNVALITALRDGAWAQIRDRLLGDAETP